MYCRNIALTLNLQHSLSLLTTGRGFSSLYSFSGKERGVSGKCHGQSFEQADMGVKTSLPLAPAKLIIV